MPAFSDIERLHFGRRLTDADAHEFTGEDRQPAKLEVGRTSDANPSVSLIVRAVRRFDGKPDWEELALLNLEPRAARHIAYAILMAANECEP